MEGYRGAAHAARVRTPRMNVTTLLVPGGSSISIRKATHAAGSSADAPCSRQLELWLIGGAGHWVCDGLSAVRAQLPLVRVDHHRRSVAAAVGQEEAAPDFDAGRLQVLLLLPSFSRLSERPRRHREHQSRSRISVAVVASFCTSSIASSQGWNRKTPELRRRCWRKAGAGLPHGGVSCAGGGWGPTHPVPCKPSPDRNVGYVTVQDTVDPGPAPSTSGRLQEDRLAASARVSLALILGCPNLSSSFQRRVCLQVDAGVVGATQACAIGRIDGSAANWALPQLLRPLRGGHPPVVHRCS